MKTAISIDDAGYVEAENTAKAMGLSRSGLYAGAVVEFLQNPKPDAITAKYNQIDPDLAQANFELFNKEDG